MLLIPDILIVAALIGVTVADWWHDTKQKNKLQKFEDLKNTLKKEIKNA